MAHKGPSRHPMDLSGVIGHALDPGENHRIYKSTSCNIGVLKGLNGKITKLSIRKLVSIINTKIKNISNITPLASGNLLIEFPSQETLKKISLLVDF